MEITKDGRAWRLGTIADTAWIDEATTEGISVTVAIPPIFEAYATLYTPEDPHVTTMIHEHAVVKDLVDYTSDQPWWLGYLDTGAHDVVFPGAPMVSLYFDWHYLIVEAGPDQALTWRTGHMRAEDGSLPDLFFPADRSWLVSALWDDTWTCIGGPASLIETVQRNPLVKARRVQPDEDAKPPGHHRD